MVSCSLSSPKPLLSTKFKVWWVIDPVGPDRDARRQPWHDGVVMTASSVPVVSSMVASAAVAILIASKAPTATSPLGAASPWLTPSPRWLGASHAVGVLEAVVVAAGLGAVVATLIGLHSPAYRFGRHASANFDIGLFHRQAADDWPAAAATKLSGEHPLAVGIG